MAQRWPRFVFQYQQAMAPMLAYRAGIVYLFIISFYYNRFDDCNRLLEGFFRKQPP
jgi:hypothetical protein